MPASSVPGAKTATPWCGLGLWRSRVGFATIVVDGTRRPWSSDTVTVFSGDEVRFGRGGSRLPWDRLPAQIRGQVESGIGGRVVSAESQPGGFSPGVAARVVLDDGRRAFVKAAGPKPNPVAPRLHRAEARIAGALPPEAPAPRLLFTYDDGDWVALAFEDVGGRPPLLPWNRDELSRVLDALGELADSLTPSPIAAPPIEAALDDTFRGWRNLAADQSRLARVDEWARRHVDRLVEREANWQVGVAGATLVHLDIRADNLLLTPEQVFVVDWPHACIGACWIDLLLMLPSVAMQGGPKPWQVFDDHRLARHANPAAVTRMVCALAGFFIAGSLQPAPLGIPNVREFQRLQGEEALTWLRRRIG